MMKNVQLTTMYAKIGGTHDIESSSNGELD